MKDEIRLIRSRVDRDIHKKTGTAPRTCALVLGMHRSGTSALTRILSLLGCDLPKTLMGADETNEAGHWESTVICKLNDRILESAGTTWDDWQEFNTGWLKSPKVENFYEEALDVLQNEFSTSRLFVLKDPRICRIAPFWLAVLERASIRPLVISPIRNPLEVAASLERRDGFDPAYSYLLWLRNVLDAEFYTRGMPRFFTSYDRLIGEWNQVAEDTQSTLDIFWPRYSEKVKGEIDASLSDKYRHHHVSAEKIINNPALSKWLRETFRILNNWVISGENPDEQSALDQIRTEFNTAVPAFAHLVKIGQENAKRSHQLELNLTDIYAKLKEHETFSSNQQKKIRSLEALSIDQQEEINSLEEDLDAAREKIAQLEKMFVQREHDVELASQKLAIASKELQQLTVSVSEKDKILHGFKEHIEILMADVNEWQTAHMSLQQVHDTKMKENDAVLENAHEEINKLKALVNKKESDLHESRLQTAQIHRAAAIELGRTIIAFLECRTGYFIRFGTRLKRKIKLLKKTDLFDKEWYLQTYKDVADERVDPLRHYIEHGASEGREPNAAIMEAYDNPQIGDLNKEMTEKTES